MVVQAKRQQIELAFQKYPGFSIVQIFEGEKGYAVLTRAAYHHQIFFLNLNFLICGELVLGGWYFPEEFKENKLLEKLTLLFGMYERIE